MVKRDNTFIEEKINELITFNETMIKEWLQELGQLKQGLILINVQLKKLLD